MSKTAFVFPGQGAQTVGMGRDFFGESAIARTVYETFDRLVTPQLSAICFEGPEEDLKRTLYTQPAILATSIAALELFKAQCGIVPVVAAGHSLGEYGALYAAGVIDLETAATLVKKRAELMENAPKGAMSAVLGLEQAKVDSVMAEFAGRDSARPHFVPVNVANYNSNDQVVISGEPACVEEAGAKLKALGAKRVLPLPVGGAFHSALMDAAAEEFERFVTGFTFANAAFPIITNVDAEQTTDGKVFQQKLSRQINSSVYWNQTMERMINQMGVDRVIEFGPGKVLTGMIRKQYSAVEVHNVFDVTSLHATLEALKQTASV